MIAWIATHLSRSRLNAAARLSARANIAWLCAALAANTSRSRACFRRLYHVEREIPSASHGRCAGRLGMIPCARRQRSERSRALSRRSATVVTRAPQILVQMAFYRVSNTRPSASKATPTLVFCHKQLNPLCDGDSLRGWNTMNCDSCSSGRLASNYSG
jgi:hypothetical protein